MSPEIYAKKILALEKEIAFFFGVNEPELVSKHYIEAIKLLDKRAHVSEVRLKILMLPHLLAAYAEVKRQTCFRFDVQKAASLELDLFIANISNAPFEKEYELLVDIYSEVFGKITDQIRNAALLRTFLYRYKNHLMSLDKPLSNDDIDFLKSIAEKTEVELKSFTRESL